MRHAIDPVAPGSLAVTRVARDYRGSLCIWVTVAGSLTVKASDRVTVDTLEAHREALEEITGTKWDYYRERGADMLQNETYGFEFVPA